MMRYEYPDKEVNHRQFELELEAVGVTGLLGVARLSRRTVDGVMVVVPKYLIIKIPKLSSGHRSQLDAVVNSHSAEPAQSEIDKAAEQTVQDRKTILEAKLTDDSVTFDELKELMRLRG